MSSDTEKIQRYIIKSTPFGELSDVLKDLDKVSLINISSPALQSSMEDYNNDHLAVISHEDGQFVTMTCNKIGENKYVNQLDEKAYTIDPFKHEVINVEAHPVELMEEVKNLLQILSIDLKNYVDKFYKNPNGSQIFMEIGEEGLAINAGFTAKNISIGKFYTGQWNSKWRITKDSIQGSLNIHAHFFEAGNVQFSQNKKIHQEFNFTPDMEENSKNIVKLIENFECKVQQSLNTTYEEMPNKFFKSLRRLAPYTKTKMSWNINSIKMNHNLLGAQK